MTAILVAITAMSLLGSMHCAGMCGAFVILATTDLHAHNTRPRTHSLLQAAYHAGRLCTYVALGAIAGGLGAAVDLTGSHAAGVQRTALIITAGMMIAIGLGALARLRGVRVPTLPAPRALLSVARSILSRATALPAVPRALVMGLATTLLPCGWLYTFVLAAGGTASATSGMLVMLAFWLGTLPVLAALGAGARALAGPLGARLPALTALALIASGVLTLVARFDLIARDLSPALGAMITRRESGLHLETHRQSEPPACCTEEADDHR